MALLERFVVLLYDRTSDIMNVNDASKQLFTQKSRSLENLPPSQEALKQHIKRASFQSNCWNKALLSNQVLPSPADWGWKLGAIGWEPLWTILPEASLSCYELIHCDARKDVLQGNVNVSKLLSNALPFVLVMENANASLC